MFIYTSHVTKALLGACQPSAEVQEGWVRFAEQMADAHDGTLLNWRIHYEDMIRTGRPAVDSAIGLAIVVDEIEYRLHG